MNTDNSTNPTHTNAVNTSQRNSFGFFGVADASRPCLIGYFDDEEKLLDAAKNLKEKNIPIVDFFTPFPVHGLDELLGIKRSYLPYITFIAGAIGLLFALLGQYYISVIDWPINVGGKPHNSFPAFIPIAFELTVLFGALKTVGAFLFFNKLYPGKRPRVEFEGVTDNRFVLVLEKNIFGVDVQECHEIFKKSGALKVEDKLLAL